MKKNLCRIFALALLGFLLLPLVAAAENRGADSDAIWSSFRDALPPIAAEPLPEAGDEAGVLELVGVKSLFSLFSGGLSQGIEKALPHIATLFGIVILASLGELLVGEGMRPFASSLAAAISAILIFRLSASGVDGIMTMLGDLSVTVSAAVPAFAAASLAMGQGAIASTSSVTLSAALALLEALTVKLLPRIAAISFAFALLDTLAEERRLDGIAKSLRNLFVTLLGILSFLVSTAMALGSGIASASDGLALRSAKYAVGNMIPLVGGTVAALFGEASGAMALLRSSLGAGAVVAILALSLPPLIYLLVSRFSFSLSGGVAHLFGAGRLERLLLEFRSVYDMLLAVGAISVLTFLFSIGGMLAAGGKVGV